MDRKLKSCTRNTQKLLKKLGFDPGPIDGIPGKRTRLAMQEALGKQAIPDRDDLRPVGGRIEGGTNWPRQSSMERFYGPPGTNHTKIRTPYTLRLAWDLNTKINRFTINKKCAASAQAVLEEVLKHYGLSEIKRLRLDLWGGCYNNRSMRGGTRKSTHAYAAAIDFDPTRNQLRWNNKKAAFARPEYDAWWRAWEAAGWVSLGRARNFDWMHVQAVRL